MRLQEHPVVLEQPFIVADAVWEDFAEFPDLGEEPVGQVLAHTADPAEGGVHPRPGDHLQQVHDHFALAHGVKQRGHGAQIHRQRAGDQEMTGDPRQFGHQHADILRPDRRFYAEEFLHRQREGQVVRRRAEIVEPVRQRKNLGIGEALGQFFGAAVEVADMRVHARDIFAVQLEDEPQHPMRAGVLRAEIEKHFLGIERFAFRPAQFRDFGHLNSPAWNGLPYWNVPGGEVGLRRRRTFGTEGVQLVLVAPQRKVLALREALEAFPHVDPAQVGMALEPDPVHVPGLALMPVGGAPDPRHRRDARRIAEAALDANAPFVRQRIEVVHRLVARRFGIMIDPADVGEEIEPQRRVFLQKPAKLDDHVRRSGEGMNAMREAKILDCPPETLRDQGAVERRLHAHGAATRSRGVPASARDFLIFS